MGIVCGLDYYDKSNIEELIQNNMISSIVLGDLFCTKRMFNGGVPELYEMMNILWRNEKKIVYQTPMYITSRNREIVIETITYINDKYPGSLILTQDVGILGILSNKCKNLMFGWNRMGRSRDYHFNQLFFEFLKQNNANFFETDMLSVVDTLKKIDIKPWLVYGNLYYKTIGRLCYCKYEINMNGFTDCSNYCKESKYFLRAKKADFKMSIDGYIMGKEICYSEELADLYRMDKSQTLVIYSKAINDLHEKLALFKN